MQKIYLLLRNNNQLGPFTIEELLEQEILPADLVWIEGKSHAWSYASELNLLKLARNSGEGVHYPPPGQAHSSVHSAPHGKRKYPRFRRSEIVPPPPSPEQKPRPAGPLTPAPMSSAFSEGDVERKAEELRQRALAAERMFHHRQPTPAPTPFQPDLVGAAENDIELVYHKRGLNIPFPQILVGGMVIAMLVAGWYGQPLFRQKIDTVDATATPLMTTQENTAAAPFGPDPLPAVLTDTTAAADSVQRDSLQTSLAVYTASRGTSSRMSASSEAHIGLPSSQPETTAVETPPVVSRKSEPEENVSKEAEKPAPIVVTAKKEAIDEKSDAVTVDEPKERKKGFLKGLFKKKKNRDEESGDEASDAGDGGSPGN
ncbi:MAG TPA: hypothetical protein VGE66_03715 [Chitinophagaceae bacterium]